MKYFLLTAILVMILLGTLEQAISGSPSATISANFLQQDLRIHKILAQAFPNVPQDDFLIKELKGGLSGTALYKVDVQDKSYVLRIQKTDILSNQDALEFLVLIEAAKKGLSPQIIYTSLEQKAILMEFVNGKTLTIKKAQLPQNVVRLANAIRESHQITGQKMEGEGLLSKAQRCFKIVLNSNLASNNEIHAALELIKECSKELTKYDYVKVRVHGDLNPRNIFLTEDRVLFIDWAETTLEDPFYDLTYFSLKFDYDQEKELLLLKSYLQRTPSLEEWNRYNLHKKIHQSFWSLTNLYLAKAELKKHPEQKIDTKVMLKNWSFYQKKFAEGSEELSAQYFYELSRLNYRLAISKCSESKLSAASSPRS